MCEKEKRKHQRQHKACQHTDITISTIDYTFVKKRKFFMLVKLLLFINVWISNNININNGTKTISHNTRKPAFDVSRTELHNSKYNNIDHATGLVPITQYPPLCNIPDHFSLFFFFKKNRNRSTWLIFLVRWA